MKEDKIAILQSSPLSVLESTRKDFESLLSQAYVTDESKPKRQKSRGRKTRENSEKQTNVEENVEMIEVASAGAENCDDENVPRHAESSVLWYEKEDDVSSTLSSKNSHKTSRSSSNQSLRTQESKPSSKQTVIHHSLENQDTINRSNDHQFSSDSDSSQVSDFNEKAASKSSPTASSVKTNEIGIKDSGSQEYEILAVIVHQLDQLLLEQPSTRPMIVAHVVNIETGKYIKNKRVPVPPQFTGTWVPQEQGLSRPTWNQELYFDFDVGTNLPEILLLFEILSEPSTNENNTPFQLAWAFLRPISRMGIRHLGPKLQLQLYRVPIRRFLQRSRANVFDIFTWFQNSRKDKYPSSLYITLKQIPQFLNKNSTLSMYQESVNQAIVKAGPLQRRRLSGQPVKLPTRKLVSFKAEVGSMAASYCPDGSYLAVAFIDGRICIYQLWKGGIHQELKGHRGNVYDLHWFKSEQRTYLISSGSDCTARLWDPSTDSCLMLPHPAYVYGARFKDSTYIATACYDQLIRLWKWNQESVHLIDSYDQHRAPVNCLCWDGFERLFTGDTAGLISVWKFTDSRLEHQMSFRGSNEENSSSHSVNWLCVHPSGNRLLSHSRGNQLWMIEPLTGMKVASYDGIYNPKLRLTSTISPCGNYVVAGSEDGSVHWFDLERGDLVAILSFTGAHPITAISFHPTDHILAICSLNPEESFAILEYQKEDTQVTGFSLVTLPRTVRSALPLPRDKPIYTSHNSPQFNGTPNLDKLQRIFRKLDLVRSWSHSNQNGHS